MITEKEYIKKTNLSHRKQFAQFFTPKIIAGFMAEWVLTDANEKENILEPAFGLGIFSRSLSKHHPLLKINGYEIDKTIMQYAIHNISELRCKVSLKNENYLTSTWDDKYGGIICNPPYFKFHDYDNSTLIPIINKKLGTKLSGFTNIYPLFLLKSIYQLKEGGKLAYIVPSEFLNSDYGVEVKRALLKSGVLKHLIIVDFTQSAFDDALTTACIILCHRTNYPTTSIKFSNITNITDLNTALTKYTPIEVNKLDPEIKWKQYYEDTRASKYCNLVPFSTFAKVSRGIATGANTYFIFNQSKKDLFHIPAPCFRPCICHATDVTSQIFTNEDFEALVYQDKNVFLFDGCSNETEPHVINYIKLGIENKIDKKHLTASRSPWYAIEKREPSPIWVSVFNRNGLRFIRNIANAYNLTTFHCVYNRGEINTDILFTYLITDIAKEIFLDNSRQYGNGLVKFELNDLNKGMVVDLRLLTNAETNFLADVYGKITHYGTIYHSYIELLNHFFTNKYTSNTIDLLSYKERLKAIESEKTTETSKKIVKHVKQLNYLDIFNQFEYGPIAQNSIVHEDTEIKKGTHIDQLLPVKLTKNCLICLVKKDNFEQYIQQSAKIYYTGKKFPSTVALNKLYYFIPYLKGKGIRDLYLIKTVRLGTHKEGQLEENKKDFRLVFEIEFYKQLFSDYKPIELKIWRAFTDTTVEKLLEE